MSCQNKGQHAAKAYACNCTNMEVKQDTLIYITSLETKQFSIEVVTMLYDTTVIPRDLMGVNDNVVKQMINFKIDGIVVNSYLVPSEILSLYDIYGEEIRKSNQERILALNHIYSVNILSIDNKYYYLIQGAENLIEKREYYLLTDTEGQIIFEKYIHSKGNFEDFMKDKSEYKMWKKGEYYAQEIMVYPFELCCKKENSIVPY